MPQTKISHPSPDKLKDLGVESWTPWSCDPSEFDWEYPFEETAYVQKGRVIVTEEGGEQVEIKAKGLLARVIQHEIDHLRGRLIIDYLGLIDKMKLFKLKRKRFLKKH